MFSPSQYVLSNASFEIRRKYDLEISKDSLIDHVKIFLLAHGGRRRGGGNTALAPFFSREQESFL